MIKSDSIPSQAPALTPTQKGLLITSSLLLVLTVMWNSQEPESLAPKLIGAIPLLILLFYIATNASAWLIALLVVGQTFFKGILSILGDSTRTSLAALPYLAVASVVGIVMMFRHDEARMKRDVITWTTSAKLILLAAIVLGGVLAFRLMETPLPEYGTSKVIGYIAFNCVPLFLILYFLRRTEDLMRLVMAFAVLGTLTGLVTELYLLISYGSIFGWGGMARFDQESFYGLQIYGGVWFARRVGMGAISALLLAYLAKKKAYVILAAGVLIFDWFVIFLTGRGPFISFTLAVCLFMGMAGVAGRLGQLWRVLALFAPALIIIFALFAGKDFLPEAVASRYDAFDDFDEFNERENRYRPLFYENAWQVFLENPTLGVGTGGWRAHYFGIDQADADNMYPHNILLELGAETGVLGLIPFLILTGIAFKIGIRHFRNSTNTESRLFATWACILLTQSFINAMISGDIYRNDLLWVCFGILGALDTAERAKTIESSSIALQAQRQDSYGNVVQGEVVLSTASK